MNISFVTTVSKPKYIGTDDVKGKVKNVFFLIKQRVMKHMREREYISTIPHLLNPSIRRKCNRSSSLCPGGY
jgi:rRNA processing protein Gar1